MRNTRIYWFFTKGWEPTILPYWACNLWAFIVVGLALTCVYLTIRG